MRKITLEPISAAAFAPYGDLLLAPSTPPRQNHAARIANARREARANLALIRSEPCDWRIPLCRLECHPDSNQLFLPLDVGRYIVVVAPNADGKPDETELRGFEVPGMVGINYHPGAWHAHMTTDTEPGIFAMLVYEDGTERDCLFAPIRQTWLTSPSDATEDRESNSLTKA